MTILFIVVAIAGTGTASQIQLCGAYRHREDAELHYASAHHAHPNLAFEIRVCPFPETVEDTP
jgi:hypothetical protein